MIILVSPLVDVKTEILKLQHCNWELFWKPNLDFHVVVTLVHLIEVEKESQLNKHLYQVHCKFH